MLSFNRNDSYFENAEEWILRWLGRIEEKQWSKGRKESKKLVISLTSMPGNLQGKKTIKRKLQMSIQEKHLFVDGGIQNITLGTTRIKTE